MRTLPTSIVLPADLKQRLEAHSGRTGAPMAVLTRRALAKYLDWLDKHAETQKETVDANDNGQEAPE